MGGEGISTSGTAPSHACSAGFIIEKSDSGQQYLVTAGHCTRELDLSNYDVNQGWSVGSNYALDGNRGGRDGQSVSLNYANQRNIDQQRVEVNRDDDYYQYQKVVRLIAFTVEMAGGATRTSTYGHAMISTTTSIKYCGVPMSLNVSGLPEEYWRNMSNCNLLKLLRLAA